MQWASNIVLRDVGLEDLVLRNVIFGASLQFTAETCPSSQGQPLSYRDFANCTLDELALFAIYRVENCNRPSHILLYEESKETALSLRHCTIWLDRYLKTFEQNLWHGFCLELAIILRKHVTSAAEAPGTSQPASWNFSAPCELTLNSTADAGRQQAWTPYAPWTPNSALVAQIYQPRKIIKQSYRSR